MAFSDSSLPVTSLVPAASCQPAGKESGGGGDGGKGRHLALVQNDDPRVPVILLLHFVFGVDAGPLHLQHR